MGFSAAVPSEVSVRPSYLDTIAYSGGGLPYSSDDIAEVMEWCNVESINSEALRGSGIDEYARELNRAATCGRSYLRLENQYDETRMLELHCHRHWCPDCGGVDGVAHKLRKRAVYRKIGDLEHVVLLRLIVTVPIAERAYFCDQSSLNQLGNSAKRLAQSVFGPDCYMMGFFHLFGEDKKRWNPHVEVHVVTREKRLYALPLSRIEAARVKWRQCLTGIVGHDVGECDIQYSYRIGKRRVCHAIRYASRPTWDMQSLMMVDEDMRRRLVLGLKNFRYIRYWGKWRGNVSMRKEEIKERIEASCLAGEKLRYRGQVIIRNPEELIARGLMIKIGHGVYAESPELTKILNKNGGIDNGRR